jgi:Flp pilus assembly pilin Flp
MIAEEPTRAGSLGDTMLDQIRERIRRRSQLGTSSVEFGLIVVAIAALITATVFVIGHFVRGAFDNTCDGMQGEVSGVTATCP